MEAANPTHQHEPGCPKLHGMTCECPARPLPPAEPILRFFAYAHLPGPLQTISEPFHKMAHNLCTWLPKNAERSVALRKLLEAKDAAVRAVLPEV